jgi:hypothetical protein
MYSTVLLLHSWIRWVALASGIGATVYAFGKGSAALARAERWGFFLTIALDLQFVLGLLLYGMLSPFTRRAMEDFGAAMRDSTLRFWAVEHVTMMLGAVILAHVGRVLARKTANPEKKRTKLLICFGLSLLLMLGGMPWPGTPNGRPLFRI